MMSTIKKVLIPFLLMFTISSCVDINKSEKINSDLKLWYNQPAEKWTDALPVGNGRLGAMIFGKVSKERIQGLEPANQEGYIVYTHEIEEGIIYTDKDVKVEAFRVDHGTLESYGYKFILPDRTIVISGDTCPSENLIKYAMGCDILIHEVYSATGLKGRTEAWRRYHSSVHTSTHELVEIARKVKPKLLILYHQLFMEQSEEELFHEITEYYEGKVVSGKDLDVF